MMSRKYGSLTEKQYIVLKLRLKGYTQKKIAEELGTSRENIAIIEKRAWKKIREAFETINIYKSLLAIGEIVLEPGTHLVDIPRILINKADELGIKLKANFTRIYDEIRFKADIRSTKLDKKIKILIFRDGDIEVVPLK